MHVSHERATPQFMGTIMEVLDLSDFNRIDEMSRLILGRLFLINLIKGGGGLRCHPKEGRIEILVVSGVGSQFLLSNPLRE
jgi:hypothetical protein